MVFDDIQFSYGVTEVLRGVFLRINSGSICGLVGRNGSGKSTLIKIGTGLLNPLSGNIFVDGICTTFQKGAKRFEKVAYLSQKSFLPRELSVSKMLAACHVRSLSEDNVIHPLLAQKIDVLSGGERRYIELRIILELERNYYLLDEPFTGTAPVLIEKMIDLIREKKKRGKGILLTDHYSRYVEEIVDDVYLLQSGYCRQRKSPV